MTLIKPIVKCALNVLTQQILHVGHWHGEYFLLCMAMGLVKCNTWPNKISQYVEEVVDLLDESCNFITTPKTPSTHSPTQSQVGFTTSGGQQCRSSPSQLRQPSLATPVQPTPHTHNSQLSPVDASNEKDLFVSLTRVFKVPSFGKLTRATRLGLIQSLKASKTLSSFWA